MLISHETTIYLIPGRRNYEKIIYFPRAKNYFVSNINHKTAR